MRYRLKLMGRRSAPISDTVGNKKYKRIEHQRASDKPNVRIQRLGKVTDNHSRRHGKRSAYDTQGIPFAAIKPVTPDAAANDL